MSVFFYLFIVGVISWLIGFYVAYSERKEEIFELENKIRNLKYSNQLKESAMNQMMQQIVDLTEGKKIRVKPFTQPRYDEIYYNGIAAFDDAEER